MNATSFLYLFVGILLNAAAQLLLKAGTLKLGEVTLAPESLLQTLGSLATNGPIMGGLCLYGFSVLTWIAGLSRVDVSIAYPLLSLGYVVNVFAAYYLFGEAITWQKALAIGIILIGVYLLARS
ncbi:MAG: EamA family transporter [Betaproteobacteria bacterium]